MAKPTLWDKFVSRVAPSYALRSYVARSRIERLAANKPSMGDLGGFGGGGDSLVRSFDSTSGSRLRYDPRSESRSVDGAIKDNRAGICQQVRQLEQNTGFVSGPIRRWVNNVVGKGIKCDPRVVADERREVPKIDDATAENWNYSAKRLFEKWSKQADKRLLALQKRFEAHVAAIEPEQVKSVIGQWPASFERVLQGREFRLSVSTACDHFTIQNRS
jgi:hypothetical protein